MSQAGIINIAGGGGGGSPIMTLTGNSGGAVPPTANNVNTLGTGSITIVGVAGTSTLTTQLTGLTNHSLLVGAGTATITNLGVASNGQLPIGSTGADPVLATLTAGAGIAIANAAGSITISNTGAGFSWNTVAGTTQTVAAENGYINGNAGLTTYLLPATGAVGDTFQLAGFGAGGWILTQNALQVIHYNSTDTMIGLGGSIASSNRYNTIEVMCIVANTDWTVLDSSGTLTVV